MAMIYTVMVQYGAVCNINRTVLYRIIVVRTYHCVPTYPLSWSELTQRLELWVEMMELNDQGEYIPCEIKSKPNVSTGGVFMISHGQSHRINVTVRTVPGSGNSPLKFDYISSISIGSICLRNRSEEPLDSYQSRDLERSEVNSTIMMWFFSIGLGSKLIIISLCFANNYPLSTVGCVRNGMNH